MSQHTSEFPFVATAPANRTPLPRTWLALATAAAMLLSLAYASVPARRAYAAAMARAAAAASPDAALWRTITSFDYRRSHNGTYGAEVIAAGDLPVRTRHSWTVLISDQLQRPVAGARVTVLAWMPEGEVVSPVAAEARYMGEGRYRLNNLYFHRPGWWNVALVITAAYGTDSLAFNVVLP